MLVMKGPLTMKQICVCYWNGLKVQHGKKKNKKNPIWEQVNKNEFSDNISILLLIYIYIYEIVKYKKTEYTLTKYLIV